MKAKSKRRKKSLHLEKANPGEAPRKPAPLTLELWKKLSLYLEPYQDFGSGCIEQAILREKPQDTDFGIFSAEPVARVLQLALTIQKPFLRDSNMVKRELAELFLEAIWAKNHTFFDEISVFLRTDRRLWRDMRARDLGRKVKQGRQPKPYEFRVVGRIALINRLMARVRCVDGGSEPLDYRLTKEELRSEIRRLQTQRGLKGVMEIRNDDLSRLIKEMKASAFMDNPRAKIKGLLVRDWRKMSNEEQWDKWRETR